MFVAHFAKKWLGAVLLVGVAGANLALAGVTVDQTPLAAGEAVPGNVIITPSVEHPTINSMANLGDYSSSSTYAGYFNSERCYIYNYNATEANRYFSPDKLATSHTCGNTSNTSSQLWSGNFLNWATTHTIDPFRKALTGGYRVKDDSSETWLEKARSTSLTGSASVPDRRLPASGNSASTVADATAFVKIGSTAIKYLHSRTLGKGNQVEFVLETSSGFPSSYTPVAFTGSNTYAAGTVYTLSVRVKVCVSGKLESNCELYPAGNYKPTGLMQKYNQKFRFSVFGYMNDLSLYDSRDGAALRAKQKYVGPKKFAPTDSAATATNPWVDNTEAEWSASTGVFVTNPNSADASATTGTSPSIANSGVVNYVNKFGQMTTAEHKRHDSVSEMYYAALRYLKNQGNISTYSAILNNSVTTGTYKTPAGTDVNDAYIQADGFPVISSWTDPYQYWCQPAAILGIGDVYTWLDKNLPGNTVTTSEPSTPSQVSADTSIGPSSSTGVLTATKKVMELEFGLANVGYATPPFNGNSSSALTSTATNNSAYLAGLAYDAHTKDLRTEDAFPGKQTASTFWVDVVEKGVVARPRYNQYYLAAKFGGFTVPKDYDPYTRTTALPSSWWSSGETLTSTDGTPTSFSRPKNYYMASNAEAMVSGLTSAFQSILKLQSNSSGVSLTANSTRLETGTMVFQSMYKTDTLDGDIEAYAVSTTTGLVSGTATWAASSMFPAWASRTIYVNGFDNKGNQKYIDLNASNNKTQATGMSSDAKVNFVLGDRSNEGPTYRQRSGLMGTIVNSQPVLVGSSKNFTTSRVPVIYVGSNDGMLHGFNANTGVEVYAFIPHSVLPGSTSLNSSNTLEQYPNLDYAHQYFVDGDVTVADAKDGSTWKTVLVGSLGAGGKAVFALDITDPTSVKFLWEKNLADTDGASKLGNNLGKPVIAQVASGQWRAFVGNGPNSSGDKAQLIMFDLFTGAATAIDTGAGSDNGLAAPNLWDSDGDGYYDTAYAGDLKGNMWRFTSLGGTPAVALLFKAVDGSSTAQPITAQPLIAKESSTSQTWVFFGTGRYLNSTDLSDTQTQSWYGVKDSGSLVTRAQLVARTGVTDYAYSSTYKLRIIPDADALTSSEKGWYMNLPVSKERMILANQLYGSVLIGTSRIPDASDRCAPTGSGFIMFINPFTGGALSSPFIDLNGDGDFDDDDKYSVNGQLTVPSGIGTSSAPYSPIFIQDRMLFNKENTEIGGLKVNKTRTVRRTSWRELRRP